MKIVVLCSDLGIRVPGEKGASLHLQSISRALQAIGHEVLLIGVAGHGPAPSGHASLLLPHPGRSHGWRRDLRRQRFVSDLTRRALPEVRAFGPDVIYERLALFGTAGARMARALSVPHVVEINALLTEEAAEWRSLHFARRARRIERQVVANADLCVCVSDEWAARIAPHAQGQVSVVPNGFDGAAFARSMLAADVRPRFGLPLDVPIVGFTGTLRPWHGIDVAVRAIASLPGVHFAIAGDGPIASDIVALARTVGAGDRVHLVGHVAHDTIPEFLSALDIAVAPYPVLEGFAFSPLKIYEYLAAGVPVVASAIGQVRDLGDYVSLVAPGDPLALSTAVRDAFANYHSVHRRAAAGRRHALAHHTWEHRAHTLAELIRHVGSLRAVAA